MVEVAFERLPPERRERIAGLWYPALERLLNKGYVTAQWAESSTGRQARFYTITASGRKQLKEEVDEYHRLSYAIARVMGSA